MLDSAEYFTTWDVVFLYSFSLASLLFQEMGFFMSFHLAYEIWLYSIFLLLLAFINCWRCTAVRHLISFILPKEIWDSNSFRRAYRFLFRSDNCPEENLRLIKAFRLKFSSIHVNKFRVWIADWLFTIRQTYVYCTGVPDRTY